MKEILFKGPSLIFYRQLIKKNFLIDTDNNFIHAQPQPVIMNINLIHKYKRNLATWLL